MRAMCCVSARPTLAQERPPSVDLYTPSACAVHWSLGTATQDSPMPTYITLGSESETASAPTAEVLK